MIEFTPYRFVEFLRYMGVGMLGVFMIVAIIVAATYAIARLTAGKSEK